MSEAHFKDFTLVLQDEKTLYALKNDVKHYVIAPTLDDTPTEMYEYIVHTMRDEYLDNFEDFCYLCMSVDYCLEQEILVRWTPLQGPRKGVSFTGICRGEEYFIEWTDEETQHTEEPVSLEYLRKQEKAGYGTLMVS